MTNKNHQLFIIFVFWVLNTLCLSSAAQNVNEKDTDYNTDTLSTDTLYKKYSTIMKPIIYAAENGDTLAQNLLAGYLYNGNYIKKSEKGAAKWWQKAAEQGNARAQYNLGLLYYKGQGVEKSDKEGDYWMNKAAEQDFELAKKYQSFKKSTDNIRLYKIPQVSIPHVVIPKLPKLPKTTPIKTQKNQTIKTPKVNPVNIQVPMVKPSVPRIKTTNIKMPKITKIIK